MPSCAHLHACCQQSHSTRQAGAGALIPPWVGVCPCVQMPMPESPPWWEAFEATAEQVHRVCAVLVELYSRPKAEVRQQKRVW